jgi:hypothetical protein
MSQLIKQEQIDAGNEDIRSIEGSEWTLETASIGTVGDGPRGNEENSTNAPLFEVPYFSGIITDILII